PPLSASFDQAGHEVTASLDRLQGTMRGFDPTLLDALGKSRGKIQYQIAKIRKKTEREILRRDQRASEEAAYLSAMLYPHGHLQERHYTILPFLAEHGMGVVDRLYEVVRMDCPDHRVFAL